MSLYQIENRAYDRMKKLFICVKTNCEYLLSIFFQKKKCQKILKDTSPTLVCIDMFFHKIQGNVGTRGVSYIVILFNPLRPKSDLNEIYHCSVKGLSVIEIMRIENLISEVKFC